MNGGTQRILVTGSSGTIGTRLVENLLLSGHEVFGVDVVPNVWNDDIQKRTVIADLRDKEATLALLPKDIDLVIHLAANARVFNLVVDPSLARDNFEMTFNVLEFARATGVKKVIFASSRETYGNSEQIVHAEGDVRLDLCESPYTASKLGGEALIHAYRNCYDIDFVIFRFSNVYGMYDRSDRVIPLFISLCRKGEDLVVYGEEKLLDFTYIDDCIGGIISVVEDFDAVKNEVYNLAYGEGTLIVDVARMVQKHIGSDNKLVIQENRTGEVTRYIADITKAKNTFGYNPKTPIDLGVEKAVQWYSEHFNQL